jgi:hypothetical protein
MMSKMVRLIVVLVALVAFGMVTLAVAADFYVVKDAAGKISVVDKKPKNQRRQQDRQVSLSSRLLKAVNLCFAPCKYYIGIGTEPWDWLCRHTR